MKDEYPSYDVEIQRVSDGEIRRCHCDYAWTEYSHDYWTAGNGSCDCNRELTFERDEDPMGKIRCSDGRFRVIRAIFPDGSEKAIDE